MARYILAVLIVGYLMFVSFLIGYAMHTPHEPHCPTEDSCMYVYKHGHASIQEITP